MEITSEWQQALRRSELTKHSALVAAIREAIRTGRLHASDRLPPARALAQSLGVAVGTVVRAYREAADAGLIRSEVGRGTFVLAERSRAAIRRRGDELIDLAIDFPLEGLDPDPADAFESLRSHPDRSLLMRYQPHEGALRARTAGVAWVERSGVGTRSADDVVITGGGQHALVVALASVRRDGVPLTVLAESLAYPGLREAAALIGANLVPIDIDRDGMCVDALEAALERQPRAAALYLVPSLHNPTTAALPASRRERIVELSRRHDLVIIEDDVHRLHADAPAAPLASLAPERTFFIASLSKTVAAGLRVAYLVCPPSYVGTAIRQIHAMQWTLPPLTAEIAALWIENGTADATVERKAREAEVRQSLAQAALASRVSIQTQPRSFYLWIDLPAGWTGERFALAAARQSVGVLGDAAFRIGDGARGRSGARICLGASPDRQTLEGALNRLGRVLDDGPGTLPGVI